MRATSAEVRSSRNLLVTPRKSAG